MSNSSTGFTRTTTTTTTDQSTLTTEACGGNGNGGAASNSPSSPSDHNLFFHPSNSEQLCYVHCTFCDTVLAVSVPCSSLFKTVTVRCGHCSNLLSVNMRALLLPAPPAAPPVNHPPFFTSPHNLLQDEIRNSSPNLLMNQYNHHQTVNNHHEQMMPAPGVDYHDLPKPPVVNRPPEKRQRVPSAYNRFIKEEIQRIKAGNPDISHREAFSAAAKNWAHFPHIHFGLMPDHQPVKKVNMRQQDGEDHVLMKDGFLSASNNIGVSPY